jgi:diguanylate cyclase
MITRQALEQIQEELQETRRLVQEDPLTGTLNRRGLDIVLSREVARCKRSRHQLALAMVDIDHFKEVNDRHGHDAGDKMLQHMTTTIRSVLRESDVLARYGGEEFLIVFPDTDISGAAFVTDRLRNLVGNTPMIYEGRKIQATISAGLAQVKGDENGQSLIMRADAALYKAKNAGRNCVKIAD